MLLFCWVIECMNIIKFKKKNKDQYELILDNDEKIVVYEDIIIKYNLLANKRIDLDLLNKINKENSFSSIYSKCIRYISIRIRSEKEIYDYLQKKLVDRQTIEKIIEKLKKNKLINDELFVQSFINDKLLLTNYGPKKIRNELDKHNIDYMIIDKYLDKVDREIFYKKINKIITRQLNNNNKYSKTMIKNKIQTTLNDLGYPKIFYIDILNSFDIEEDDNILRKEAEKQYNKLSNKYEDKELKTKLKQKLYQKGFSAQKIDNILSKIID